MNEITLNLAEGQLAGFSNFLLDTECNSTKPILLMLHGWQDNAATFERLAELLSDDCRILAVDWPGHGLSAHRSADNYYHFFDYIDDLHQVIKQLPNEPIYILGHSLGAIIASCYAAVFPEHVARLILIEGVTPLVEPSDKVVQRLRDGIESRQRYRRKVMQRQKKSMPSFETALRLRASANNLPSHCLEAVVKRGTFQCDGKWYWRHDERLRCDSLYRMAQQHVNTLMADIKAPILSIIGMHGYPSLRQDALAKYDWCSFLQVIVKGGHHCHLESPEQVYKQIQRFLFSHTD